MEKVDRLALLKKLVEENSHPIIQNCSSVSDSHLFTMNDLQELGWMFKSYTHDLSGEVDGWERFYSGPAPVLVKTIGSDRLEILKPGETLE